MNPTLGILRLPRHRDPLRLLGVLGISRDSLRYVYVLTKTYHSLKDNTIPVPAGMIESAVRAAHRSLQALNWAPAAAVPAANAEAPGVPAYPAAHAPAS